MTRTTPNDSPRRCDDLRPRPAPALDSVAMHRIAPGAKSPISLRFSTAGLRGCETTRDSSRRRPGARARAAVATGGTGQRHGASGRLRVVDGGLHLAAARRWFPDACARGCARVGRPRGPRPAARPGCLRLAGPDGGAPISPARSIRDARLPRAPVKSMACDSAGLASRACPAWLRVPAFAGRVDRDAPAPGAARPQAGGSTMR